MRVKIALARLALLMLLVIPVVGSFSVAPSSVAHAKSTDCSTANVLFFVNIAYGMSCLDGNGWHSYTSATDQVRGSISTFALCADGSILAATFDTLYSYDASGPKPVGKFSNSIQSMACSSLSDVWAASFSGFSHFDGKHWTTLDVQSDLGAQSSSDTVSGVSIAPDKSVWVVLEHNFAIYKNGTDWKSVGTKDGLDATIFLSGKAAFDNKGMGYIISGSGTIVTYDGSNIGKLTNTGMSSAQTLAADDKGNLYVGTNENGMYVYNGTDWKNYTIDDGLSANNVQSITVDAKGRAWIATEWGLNVLDMGEFTKFTMSNSNLVDNNGRSILVIGDGPGLPAPLIKKPGTVKGVIDINDKPLANSKIQLCSLETFLFTGDTPCGTMPDSQTTTTDSNGAFEFDKVAIGRFNISFQTTKGWAHASGEMVDVSQGQILNMGTLKFNSSSS